MKPNPTQPNQTKLFATFQIQLSIGKYIFWKVYANITKYISWKIYANIIKYMFWMMPTANIVASEYSFAMWLLVKLQWNHLFPPDY